MKAIEITEFGGPEVLVLGERPMPSLQEGEVLIKVAAAGVNRPDAFQRQGGYPPPPGASDIPGLELAGEIVAGDVGQSGFVVGDKVCALVSGGAYAEYCAVPVQQCLPIPQGLSLVQAAGLPETFFTVWSNVFERGELSQGESLLVHGGASGIGTTAIQLAVALGHKVYATAGSDERVEAINKLGAIGINYRTQQYEVFIKEHTQGKGVDVVLDMVAGEYINRDLKCLADDGRVVIIAMLGGARATVNCAEIMTRRLTITGSTLRARPVAFKAEIANQLREHVWPLIESGLVTPQIFAQFPLSEAAQAHAMMEAGEQIGKIILLLE